MDSINFAWLNNDEAIIDSLVSSSTIPNNGTNTSNDILQYLLQPTNESNDTSALSVMTSTIDFNAPILTTEKSTPPPTMASEFRSTLSIVESKDNFVTFMPLNTPKTKKQSTPKKTKFKEPIFVTESPQNAYKKKKKTKSNDSSTHSSDENSDDDMLLDEEFSPSNKMKLSSKERRQIRNKISARNFRVRRKEYITQLEEKVEQHENTIQKLKDENAKLRSANDEIMKQLLTQPITPPSSSADELLSSSSSSEGNHSPEANAVPSMFQFQLNDLYDFNLFDQQQQQQQQNMVDTSNLFYLNHAVMPDWDIHQVLGEKGRPITSEETQQQMSRDLFVNYPLLAPALMSIVIRHTLSLEYVTALAKEFSESIKDSELPAYVDEGYKIKEALKIEHTNKSEPQPKEEKKDRISDDELTQKMLTDFFPTYVFMRARGYSHQKVMDKCRECFEDENSKCNKKKAKKNAKKSKQETCPKTATLSTLHTYCRVAGTLLRSPQRMTRLNEVLKEEISFTHNKHTSRIESKYASLINPLKNLRITGTSK